MSRTKRRILAAILLIILIGVPFLNWRLGALLWMCAWLVSIFQNVYSGNNWKLGKFKEREDEQD